jgi:hypothetical protein
MGFLIESVEYYKHMSSDIQSVLKSSNEITSQYIRTRADRVAIHREKGVSFQVEFKTHNSRRTNNMMIQALPLAVHLWNSQIGVKCLYVYGDPVSGLQKGFWADQKNRPPVKKLRFTRRRDLPKKEMYGIFEKAYPELKQYYTDEESTGQPYVIVDYEEVRKLKDWSILVSELFESS